VVAKLLRLASRLDHKQGSSGGNLGQPGSAKQGIRRTCLTVCISALAVFVTTYVVSLSQVMNQNCHGLHFPGTVHCPLILVVL
jgi:hypothetical protein